MANASEKPEFKLEYLTYPVSRLHLNEDKDDDDDGGAFAYPVPPRNLPKSLRTAAAENRTKSRYAPYGLADLTVGSWLGLADELGGSGNGKEKRAFRRFMYETVEESDVE
jgi:endopolyphosphatase